jgi:hypothetical protein
MKIQICYSLDTSKTPRGIDCKKYTFIIVQCTKIGHVIAPFSFVNAFVQIMKYMHTSELIIGVPRHALSRGGGCGFDPDWPWEECLAAILGRMRLPLSTIANSCQASPSNLKSNQKIQIINEKKNPHQPELKSSQVNPTAGNEQTHKELVSEVKKASNNQNSRAQSSQVIWMPTLSMQTGFSTTLESSTASTVEALE